MTPREVLFKYWGYDAFRPLQEEIINAVLEGSDVLALLPTGGGKSICFQVPAMIREGLCIVVSPLIALMKDQVQNLNERGIKAVAVYSGLSHREIDVALDNCVNSPEIKFLYCSPERLKTDILRERVGRMNVSLLAIDEAHCISQWGYDFRPPYLEIAEFRQLIPEVNTIALTASATPEVVKDIAEKLEFDEERIFQKSFARENLSYSIFKEENKEKKLLQILNNVPGSSVVYVRNRKKTRDVARWLQQNGVSADYYHAGLTNQQRERKQAEWILNFTRVIVATNAFGMGIDKPDVRTVIHLDIPDHMEAYYQEAGRAGRDEKKAYAVLLYHEEDIKTLESRLAQEFPDVETLRHTYQQLANYYKVAVGSSLLTSYDFDLNDFSQKNDLSPNQAYYSLKKLEEEGFIQLSESFYEPSKLNIIVDHEVLYKFQVAHENHDDLIKVLLRLYGGELYTGFIKISERKISNEVGENVTDVIKKLQFLNDNEVVRYHPQKEMPQITFLTQRYDAGKLPIDTRVYLERKKSRLSKMNAMIGYIQRQFCRSRTISDYFGERNEKDCGICDICLDQKNKGQEDQLMDKYRDLILENLDSPLLLDQLIQKSNPEDLILFSQAVREMIDRGELKYLEDGKIDRAG